MCPLGTLKMLQCRAYCQMRPILLNFLYVRIFSSLPSSFSPLLSSVSLCLPISISFSLLRILKTEVKGCCIWNWYGDLYICNGYLWNGHASKTIVWWYRWLWPIRETHIFLGEFHFCFSPVYECMEESYGYSTRDT